jgi:hypothetical protein
MHNSKSRDRAQHNNHRPINKSKTNKSPHQQSHNFSWCQHPQDQRRVGSDSFTAPKSQANYSSAKPHTTTEKQHSRQSDSNKHGKSFFNTNTNHTAAALLHNLALFCDCRTRKHIDASGWQQQQQRLKKNINSLSMQAKYQKLTQRKQLGFLRHGTKKSNL